MNIARTLIRKIGRPLLPGIPQLPPGAILLFGRRLASLSSPHKLIGFYLPDIGIFDIEGRFVGGKSARIKTQTIQEKQSQVLVDEKGKQLAFVRIEVRAAFDLRKNQIVGVLQSFEPLVADTEDEDIVE